MQNNDKVDFSRFGKSFQESRCQLVLQDRPFADQISEVLDYNFFELKYLQVFIKKIFSYRDKYGVHPSPRLCLPSSGLTWRMKTTRFKSKSAITMPIYDQDIRDKIYQGYVA